MLIDFVLRKSAYKTEWISAARGMRKTSSIGVKPTLFTHCPSGGNAWFPAKLNAGGK